MAKQTSLKNKLFVSKVSKTTSVGNSHRAIIPNELLTRLKITVGDQLIWKLDEKNTLRIWKRTKRDRLPGDKVIDVKEASPVVKTDMKKVTMSTADADSQPQITATNHI